MGTFELEYDFNWTTAGSPTIFGQDLSHLTPPSEPVDVNDSVTPISLYAPFEFPSLHQMPTLNSLNTNIEAPPPPSHHPRCSPSTSSPAPGGWTPEPRIKQEIGLGIRVVNHHLTPASSPRPRHHKHSSSSTSEASSAAPVPTRHWIPIAPNPVGLRQLQASASSKRALGSEEEDGTDGLPTPKRKRSASPSPYIGSSFSEMTAEDALLLKLKDEENLSWKEIASRFQTDMNMTFRISALQMRLKRLRERMRVWTEVDVQALRMAHDYWKNRKFEIIAAKVRCELVSRSACFGSYKADI
jgi:hypothetical protein